MSGLLTVPRHTYMAGDPLQATPNPNSGKVLVNGYSRPSAGYATVGVITGTTKIQNTLSTTKLLAFNEVGYTLDGSVWSDSSGNFTISHLDKTSTYMVTCVDPSGVQEPQTDSGLVPV